MKLMTSMSAAAGTQIITLPAVAAAKLTSRSLVRSQNLGIAGSAAGLFGRLGPDCLIPAPGLGRQIPPASPGLLNKFTHTPA